MLIKEQATQVPATYQLATYLENKKGVVYTWEETRVLEYLHVPYEHKRIYQYEYFLEDTKYQHSSIYVTNHLLQGFSAQRIDVTGKVERVKTFRSNPLFDPVYSTITLYKWKGD